MWIHQTFFFSYVSSDKVKLWCRCCFIPSVEWLDADLRHNRDICVAFEATFEGDNGLLPPSLSPPVAPEMNWESHNAFQFQTCLQLPQRLADFPQTSGESERSEPRFRGALQINGARLIGSPDCIWFGIDVLNTRLCWLAAGPRSLDPNLLSSVGPEGCLSCLTERIKDNIKR